MEEKRNMDWKTLKSEYLIRCPWLTARRDTVELPNGVVNDEFYVLEYPDWVNIVAITTDGRYVFVRQYRHGLGRTCYEITAGVMEKGETPLEAAKRELREETGCAGGEWSEIMTVSANASCTNNLTHCFLAKGVDQVDIQHLDRTEDIEIHFLDEREVKKLLDEGQLMQATMVAPLWKIFCNKLNR